MRNRIKDVRSTLNLSRAAFGEKIGVSGDVINNLERGRVEIKEHIIKLIRSEFSVNEEWLRNGEGEMFLKSSELSLDEFCKSRNMSDLEFEILKAYFNLPQNIRQQALNHFISISKNLELLSAKNTGTDFIEKEKFLKLAEEQFDKEKKQESQASSVSESDVG